MKKARYTYLCREAEAGRDAFVIHPATLEEGRVNACALDAEQLIVRTPAGETRRWGYPECEELSRMNQEWPRR